MILLKQLGFYIEKPTDEASALLIELRNRLDQGIKDRVVCYLQSAPRIYLVAGIAFDLLEPARPVIGPPHVHTDGIWAWTADVIYYVQKYNCGLPEEFLLHMEQNSWQVPEVAHLDQLTLPGLSTGGAA